MPAEILYESLPGISPDSLVVLSNIFPRISSEIPLGIALQSFCKNSSKNLLASPSEFLSLGFHQIFFPHWKSFCGYFRSYCWDFLRTASRIPQDIFGRNFSTFFSRISHVTLAGNPPRIPEGPSRAIIEDIPA